MDLLRCWLWRSCDERAFMAAEIPPAAAFFYIQDAKCEMRFRALWEKGPSGLGIEQLHSLGLSNVKTQ